MFNKGAKVLKNKSVLVEFNLQNALNLIKNIMRWKSYTLIRNADVILKVRAMRLLRSK